MSVLSTRPSRSLLKVLTLAVLTLSSTAAMAVTPDQVIQKAQAVKQYLRTNAYQMNPRELAVIDLQLSRILRGGGDPGPGPGPNPYPGPGPGPNPYPNPYPDPYPQPYPQPQSQCRLLGIGNYGNYRYNFRLAVNDQAMEASDSLDTILGKITQYRRDGICSVILADVLTLAPIGNYGNYRYNFRVMLGGTAITASDSLDTALGLIAKLDAAEVGRVYSPNVACQLLPLGNYGNYSYRYRVGLGAEVMTGTDSYSTATSVMQKLRAANLCY